MKLVCPITGHLFRSFVLVVFFGKLRPVSPANSDHLSGDLRSSSLATSIHLLRQLENNKPLRRQLSSESFFRREPFFSQKPVFFHLLRTSPPSYTTFAPFCCFLTTPMKTATHWIIFPVKGGRRWRSGRRSIRVAGDVTGEDALLVTCYQGSWYTKR